MFGWAKRIKDRAKKWLANHPEIMATVVPFAAVHATDVDFSQLVDLLMAVLPILIVVSLISAIMSAVAAFGKRRS